MIMVVFLWGVLVGWGAASFRYALDRRLNRR